MKITYQTPDEVEAVFYEAFGFCDAEVMAALWADGDVVCVHPGSGAVVGHTEVSRSWAHIFANAQRPQIRFKVAKRSHSTELAVHIVTEEIYSGDELAAVVLATNVYQKFASGWLMVEHHASLVQSGRKRETLQ